MRLKIQFFFHEVNTVCSLLLSTGRKWFFVHHQIGFVWTLVKIESSVLNDLHRRPSVMTWVQSFELNVIGHLNNAPDRFVFGCKFWPNGAPTNILEKSNGKGNDYFFCWFNEEIKTEFSEIMCILVAKLCWPIHAINDESFRVCVHWFVPSNGHQMWNTTTHYRWWFLVIWFEHNTKIWKCRVVVLFVCNVHSFIQHIQHILRHWIRHNHKSEIVINVEK